MNNSQFLTSTPNMEQVCWFDAAQLEQFNCSGFGNNQRMLFMMVVIDEKVGTEMFAHQLHDFAHANLAFLFYFIVIWQFQELLTAKNILI